MIHPHIYAAAHASYQPTANVREQWLAQIAKRDQFIHFYDHQNPNTQCFGNFYQTPIAYNGLTFRCSEAAFQAAKFPHNPGLQQQFTQLDGHAAWSLAKQHAGNQRSDWLKVNVDIMREVLQAKFTHNTQLQRLLIATGDAFLVEHTPTGRDAFWGDNGDGTGKNMLGQLLMEQRCKFGGHGIVNPPVQYMQFVQTAPPSTVAKICALPGCKKGCFVESNGHAHSFCGRKHVEEFKQRYHKIKCSLPGCDNPPYIETSGRVHDYCCKSHALAHK